MSPINLLTSSKTFYNILFILGITLSALFINAFRAEEYTVDSSNFVIYESDPSSGKLRMFWNDDQGNPYGSIGKLKKALSEKNNNLLFAMNGGMYMEDQTPLGLYIEEGEIHKELNRTKNAYGNFYLQPNGVFSISKSGVAKIETTESFKMHHEIHYATQSGPMLLIDGEYHNKLKKGSTNLHIRNAVGILPDERVMFVMSKEPINFYDLATIFKQKGCRNALYLDGFVSRTYAPSENWKQLDGNFGVIIGEIQ